uniref:TIL domain containing protein n=1 Tax=Rhipicephalus zambeziensis TaxID=60191 RepID=A0A224YPK7_9ACAR
MRNSGVVLLFLGALCICLVYTSARHKCYDTEVQVWYPMRDRFCKPWITFQTEMYKGRYCLCKQGYVRNAWGHCIKESECNKCIYVRNADYNQCSSSCPLVCGQRPPSVCTLQCAIGCACAPGFVLDPWYKKYCVPASTCPPSCPRNSVFQTCTTTCPQTCENPYWQNCKIQCHRGECTCLPGYVKKLVRGEEKCVSWNRCSLRE